MPNITKAQAQANLDAWVACDKAVAEGGQSYTIGDRSFTRANLPEIRQQIAFWQRAVNELEAASLDKRSPMAAIAKFT